jgi:hypothetical protein
MMPNTARGTRGRGRAAQKLGITTQPPFRPAPKAAAPKAAAPKAKPAAKTDAKPAGSKPSEGGKSAGSKWTEAEKKAYQEARKSKTAVVTKGKTVTTKTNSADDGKDHARISHMRVHRGLQNMDASCGNLEYEKKELVLAKLAGEGLDCAAWRYTGVATTSDVMSMLPDVNDTTNTSQSDETKTPEQRFALQKAAYAAQRLAVENMLPATAKTEFKQIETHVMQGDHMTSFTCKEEKKVRPGHQNWYDIHVRADVFKEQVKKARLAMDAADEQMKTQNVPSANNDKPLTYEQSGGFRFMAWPECSGNKDEHYEISVPVLLRPKGITYRSALGDDRTSKMTPALAKKYNELFHKVCVACAKVHQDNPKPV